MFNGFPSQIPFNGFYFRFFLTQPIKIIPFLALRKIWDKKKLRFGSAPAKTNLQPGGPIISPAADCSSSPGFTNWGEANKISQELHIAESPRILFLLKVLRPQFSCFLVYFFPHYRYKSLIKPIRQMSTVRMVRTPDLQGGAPQV